MTSKWHEIIHSVGVIVSVVLSSAAIWISWGTYRQNNEDVRFWVYASRIPIALFKWTDPSGNQRYLIDRRYTILFVNLSTQPTSIVTMSVADSRPGGNSVATSPALLEGEAEKPFHPVLMGADESKELEVVYREFIPKECEFAELKATPTNPAKWEQIDTIFDNHKRTFLYCDPFPEKPISISHEHIVFTIDTARGLRRVATTHEFVEFDQDGKYKVVMFTPDLN